MSLHRRHFVNLAVGAAALPLMPYIARAQTYPARPVRVIVGYAAGNASDIVARIVTQALSERLGQRFIVENRPGASGTLATGAVAKAAPDGYTLLEVLPTNLMISTLYPNLNYDFMRDIAPVARLGESAYVMVVTPSVPVSTVPEFIAYAKANPGKINMASTGKGTSTHVFGELFSMTAGIEVQHVPYRGSYMSDLLGGQVQLVFGPLAQSIEYIRAGKLRALAVTTAKRQAALTGVPAMHEFLPGYEASGWYGIGAPKGTPNEIVGTLNREVNASLADPKVNARLTDLGVVAMPTTPSEFGTFIAAETEKWVKVIRAANIKPE